MTKVGKNILGEGRKFHPKEIAWARGANDWFYTLDDFINGATNAEEIFGSADFNDYTMQGSFSIGGSGIFAHAPMPSGLYGVVHVTVRSGVDPYQVVHTHNNKMYRRNRNNGIWTEWKEL